MAKNNGYNRRIADEMLKAKLEAMGAVLIEGPKACGKTTTAEQQAKTVIYIDDPRKNKYYLQLAETDMTYMLSGNPPLLIDEWQQIPQVWDAIRFEIDHRQDGGQFILTGSAVPTRTDKIHHTGTGRFAWLTMRPMSLWESKESSGDVSLGDLFEGNTNVHGFSTLDIEKLAFAICRGGWPGAIRKSDKAALSLAIEYFEAIIHSDISRADGVNRDAERTRRLMRSYARHQGSQATIPTILADMTSNESKSISDETIASYLSALRKIFVIEDMTAWNPNLRSKTAIRTSDTRYYVDPSIAAAALGLGPKNLLQDLNTFGLLFETMAVRDLRVYADALGGHVYHYRDRNGLECDAVVHLRDGSYGLIEIKLGGNNLIDDGAKTLLALANIIDTTKMKSPSFLMVLTGVGEYAYKRPDGVLVVPIGSLKH